MIRERVDIEGMTRPMEPKEELEVLKIPKEEIGLIREDPCIRWLDGQTQWDKTYHTSAKKAIRKRRTFETKAHRMLENAKDEGLITATNPLRSTARPQRATGHERSMSDAPVDHTIQDDRRWGPLDLADEQPPPSAIANRKDTVRRPSFS